MQHPHLEQAWSLCLHMTKTVSYLSVILGYPTRSFSFISLLLLGFNFHMNSDRVICSSCDKRQMSDLDRVHNFSTGTKPRESNILLICRLRTAKWSFKPLFHPGKDFDGKMFMVCRPQCKLCLLRSIFFYYR